MEDYKNKYEDALKRAKQFISKELFAECNGRLVEYIFPELKESDDEKIRKDLISCVNEFWERIGSINPEYSSRSEMIAWLEKQGEQKPTDEIKPRFKVGDIVINKKSKDTVKIVQILHDSYRYSGWDGAATVHSDFSISEQDNWELVVQKPAWSEEDERKITGISMVLESWDSYHVSSAGLPSLIPEYISWLNSLKERIKGE